MGMSNEKAVNLIRGLIEWKHTHNLDSEDVEALTIAADALGRIDALDLAVDMERRRLKPVIDQRQRVTEFRYLRQGPK